MRINYNLKFSVILFWSSLLINILFTQVIIEGDEIFGTGIDGELYVAEDEIFYIDQVITQLSGSASTGQNQITISNTSGFNINDEILIVNIQDPTFYGLNCPYLDEETNLTGNHETHYIEDISGNVLILKESLKYNYNSYTQVIRIPNYSNMIIDGTLTCNAWDGSLGGNIAFSVSDTLIVNGQITVNGLGFRGGPGGYWDSNDWDLSTGKPGEGLVGYGWNQSDCSWAFHRINGGGGGITPCGSYYVGAGGGGNSTAGIGPSLNGCGPATEGGIAIFTENGEDRLLFGGAGGGGGRTTQNGTGGDGANGGGMIIFFANYLMGNGSISANGNSAVSVSSSQGGGGAGGTIRIILGDHEYNGSINASGGQGGSCTNNCANYSNGGIGGLGRVRIDMDINSSPPSSNPQNYIGILGCTDSEGYNYDSNADSDYNFCDYYYDCNGVLNGDALLDNCGSCDNDLSNDCNVVINEIMQNPSSVSDNDGEWFEIENIGTESINLNGWAVKDNGTDNHIINSDILIESGGIAVLGNNLNVSENGGVTLSYEYIDFNLGNSNDEIIIINNQGITMDSVAYDGGPDFPDPNGASMALLNSLVDNNVGANWIESNTIYGDGDMGTPGVPNFDAEILLSDSSIVMDTTWIGSISTKELTIINNGTQDLNILSVSTNSNEFNASPENGIVTIGESFPMTITFEPDYPDYSGSYSDTLTIETDDFENQIILIDLNGYGYRPVPLIDLPTSLTFQDTPEFQTSTEFVTITNPGDTTLTITSITSDTEIFQSEYTNFLVGPGSFFEIPINFIPVNNELYNGILNILSDGININFINLSINFDGIDDKIIIPNDATLDVGSGSATYEFYIKTTYNGIGNIIHSFDSAVSPAFHSGLDGGKITAWCRNSNGEWGLNSIMSIDDDNWHHIAVIKDSNNEKLIIYIDGIFDNERSINFGDTWSDQGLFIGQNYTSPYCQFMLEELRYWGKALTQEELFNIYNIGNENLLGYWKFNEGSGSQIIDFSGNNNHGVITGGEEDEWSTDVPLDVPPDVNPIGGQLLEIDIQLSGNGIRYCEIDVSSDELTFDVTQVGLTTNNNLIIENIGTIHDLKIDSIFTDNEDFTILYTDTLIAPGETIILPVQFSPTEVQSYNNSLTINSNDPNEPTSIISLNGIGIEPNPEINIDVSTISFGESIGLSETIERQINIQNLGVEDLEAEITLELDDDSPFILDIDEVSLEYNEIETITLSFYNEDNNIARDTLSISSNDPFNDLILIPLQANAHSGPVWHVSINGSNITGDGSEEMPFETIQQGLNVSSDGDTILVNDGDYYESLNIPPYLTVMSVNGPESTIIYNYSGHGLLFQGSFGGINQSTLKGFTITGGVASGGGGVEINGDDQSPILEDLIITGNQANQNGGGISIASGASPIINNCVISNNFTDNGNGGGIVIDDAQAIINNTIIQSNSAQNGGGVYINTLSEITFNNCLIVDNTTNLSDGAGMYISGVNGVVNLINTTVTQNFSAGLGGALYVDGGMTVNIHNSIFWDNNSGNYCNGTFSNIYVNGNLQINYINIDYSDIQNGVDEICLDQENYLSWSDNNIDLDPQFNNDYTLQLTSPCIDAGDPNSPLDPDGSIADIGAYYYDQTYGCTDPDANNFNPYSINDNGTCVYQDTYHVHPQGSDELGNGSEGLPFASIQHAIDISYDSDTVYVNSGTYYENINFNGKNIAVIGEDRSNTILSSNQPGHTVIEPYILKSITVANAYGDNDAHAIYGGYMVDDCIITNNNYGAIIGTENVLNSLISNNYLDTNDNPYNSAGYTSFQGQDNFYIYNTEFIENTCGNNCYASNIMLQQGAGLGILEKIFILDEISNAQATIILYPNTNLTLINTTIINNTNHSAIKRELQFGQLEIVNTIIYQTIESESPDWQIFGCQYAEQNPCIINYSIIKNLDMLDYVNGIENLDSDPQFTDPENGDYTLQFTSPCIDVGNPDLDGDGEDYNTDSDDQDPDGTRLDIGAFYFDQIEFPIISGCMDPDADNYNSEANVNSGCEYTGPTYYVSTDGSDFFGIGTELNPFFTIQKGIDEASEGDSVLVSTGTYYENISFGDQNLVLISLAGSEFTIIDGLNNGRVMDGFGDGIDTTTIIDGFTIQNGYSGESSSGGGISTGKSIYLKNCLIKNNTAHGSGTSGFGGGLYATGTSVIVENCEFYSNSGEGRAICLQYDTGSIIRNSIFHDSNGGDGNVILFLDGSNAAHHKIIDSDFYNCGSPTIHSLYTSNDSLSIINSNFYDIDGSGLVIDIGFDANFYPNYLNINNSTFKNIGLNNTTQQIGLIHSSAENTIIENSLFCNMNMGNNFISLNNTIDNIFINNTVYNINQLNGKLFYIMDFGNPNDLQIISSIIYSNNIQENDYFGFYNAGTNSNIDVWYSDFDIDLPMGIGLLGNINLDPLFVDPENGDFNLQWGSPAIDSGDPDSELDSDSTRADMGAYFFDQTDPTPPTVTITGISSSDIGTDDEITLEWNAHDNWVLDFAFIDIIYADNTTIRIDTVMAEVGQSTFAIPDSIIGSATIQITVWDYVQNEAIANTDINIYDNTLPIINFNYPTGEFSIAEYEELPISWNGSDNIEIDYVDLFYANDGINFIFQDAITSASSEYIFVIPLGVSNNAQIKLTAYDIYNNQSNAFSDHFIVTDNTPPEITNLSVSSNNIGMQDQVNVYWVASDNSVLDSAFIDLLYSDNIIRIANTFAEAGEVSIEVPDSTLESFRLIVTITDLSQFEVSDTTEFVNVFDNINPVINFIYPTSETSIPENNDIEVSWVVSDNIGLTDNLLLGLYDADFEVGASLSSYLLSVGQGVTESAYIQITLEDLAGNQVTQNSQYFTITDNTPPNVQIISPEAGDSLVIGDSEKIEYLTSDNVGVVDSYFNYMFDGEWIEFIPQEINDTLLFITPNQITDNFSLMMIVEDAVGLKDTSIVSDISLYLEYPYLDSYSTNMIDLHNISLSIEFSNNIDPTSLSNVMIESNVFNELDYSFIPMNGGSQYSVVFNTQLASRDTLTIPLLAYTITDIYGQNLDGNQNGILEGSPTDDIVLKIPTETLGDFDMSTEVNFDDLALFTSSWYASDYNYEMGPYTGEIPHIIPTFDQDFDIEDLMAFVLMWEWSDQTAEPLARELKITGEIPDIIIIDETIQVFVDDITSAWFKLNTDKDLISVEPVGSMSLFDLKFYREWINLGDYEWSLGSSEIIREKELSLFKLDSDIMNTIPVIIQYEMNLESGEVLSGYVNLEYNPIPNQYYLNNPYPNPFNPVTNIKYGLPKDFNINISVFDLQGRMIEELINEIQDAGNHNIEWNADRLPSGVYFVKLDAGEFTQTQKVMLVK